MPDKGDRFRQTQSPCGTDLSGGSDTEAEQRKNSPGVTSDLKGSSNQNTELSCDT